MQRVVDHVASRRYTYLLVLYLGLTLYHAVAVHDYGRVNIDGQAYFLIADDMMISMRYARNLAEGNGLVYNAGERVEGFSNPLSTLLAAGFHLLPLSPTVLPGLLQLSNLLFSTGIAAIAARFWEKRPGGVLMGLLGTAFYIALPNHAFHAVSGYEVYLLMLILLVTLWRIDNATPLSAFVLGLLPLAHAIAEPLWLFLVVAMFAVSKSSPARRAVLALVAAAPCTAYEVFRILYYNDVQPNTYWLKGDAGTIEGGIQYALGWLPSVGLLVPFALYGLLRQRETKTIVIAMAIGVNMVATVLLGGDIFSGYRFLFPSSLLIALLAGRGMVLLLEDMARLSDRRMQAAYAGVLLVAACAVIAVPIAHYRLAAPQLQDEARWNLQHLAEGLAIKQNTSPTTVVALFALGYSGYYGRCRVIDMLGKADRHISRVRPVPGRPIGHNKTDFDYVLARRPDYVENWLTTGQLQDEALLRKAQRDRAIGYLGDLSLNPTFRQIYMPNEVRDERGNQMPFYAVGPGPVTWNLSGVYAPAGSEH